MQNKTVNKNWTKDQTIVAFNLYCKIPFNRVTSNHPDIIKIAKTIGRSPNSVKMKIGNFGSFDPELKKRGIVGLANTSKLDKEVWDEFNSDWEKLAYESEVLIAKFKKLKIEEYVAEYDFEKYSEGKEKESIVKTRINQSFFRQTVLSAYNNTCCITGINNQSLLIASHIIPWSENKKLRLNPHNGLCLNSLHDKAFDKHLITVTPDYRLLISKQIKGAKSIKVMQDYFIKYDNMKINLPERFVPEKSFLEQHYKRFLESDK
jgi:putative restriction endonuclease